MMSATDAARNRRRTHYVVIGRAPAHFCGAGIDPLSQSDVMKLPPHPGTTELFGAIKENPRRKNCVPSQGPSSWALDIERGRT
jgi:hypothetical protein